MTAAAYADLLAENLELDQFVSSLSASDWSKKTAFFDWTVRDQILHLYQVDRFGLISLEGDHPFADTVTAVRSHQADGVELSGAIRAEFENVGTDAVLTTWRSGYHQIVEALDAAQQDRRLDWFGPPMGIESFAAARLMEVWAHGQDIYDLFAARRTATTRLRSICELGVKTFGWSFRNRGLEKPKRPSVHLTGPDGANWKWAGESDEIVEGLAEHFALVVTQRRAPEDTDLKTSGEVSNTWLSIAQCFAGKPQEPTASGSRPSILS